MWSYNKGKTFYSFFIFWQLYRFELLFHRLNGNSQKSKFLNLKKCLCCLTKMKMVYSLSQNSMLSWRALAKGPVVSYLHNSIYFQHNFVQYLVRVLLPLMLSNRIHCSCSECCKTTDLMPSQGKKYEKVRKINFVTIT